MPKLHKQSNSKETDRIKKYQRLLDISANSVLDIHTERENLQKALKHYSKSKNEFKDASNNYQTAEKNKLEKTRPLEKSDFLFGASFASTMTSGIITSLLIGSFTGPFIVIVMPIICCVTLVATIFGAIYKASKDQRFENALTQARDQCYDKYKESKSTLRKAGKALDDAYRKLRKTLDNALDSVGIDKTQPYDAIKKPDRQEITLANRYSTFAASVSDTPPSFQETVRASTPPPKV